MKNALLGITVIALLASPATALAQYHQSPNPEVMDKLYPGKTYSPYAQRSFPSRVFWGDTHLHTGLSLDAGIWGNTLGHEEAYRLALGEEVTCSTGLPVKLSRPLDWLVITDHSDNMGLATGVQNGAPNILANPKSRKWAEGFAKGGAAANEAALDLISSFTQGTIPEQLLNDYSPGSPVYNSIWEDITKTADRFNDPGRFTALIGFEWTSVPLGFNLHRNVILRDGGDRARQVVPAVTQPPHGSTDEMALYAWLENYESKTGGQAFALAHNGNLSNGWMFPLETRYSGGKVDKAYVEARAKWEPLYEVTQIKGDGETHPFLSLDDEFADYETWDYGNLDLSELKTNEMLKTEYAREALKQGLAMEKKFGVNPHKFGLAGATDSHTGLATAEEENFFGKSVGSEPSPGRIDHPFMKTEDAEIPGYAQVASGYQGVWATENTREAIWDAMVRRETYATTGPRMIVRFFGGWEFTENDLRSRAPAFRGYEKGVPMGGDLMSAPAGKSPTFMVVALRDPIGANLDRVQIIKGWMDGKGELHEKIYDLAVSDGRTIGADGRCKTPVGNTVDLEAATWQNTIGASELGAVWTDPDFESSESAFYYVRVLEIPTPRWIVYDKVRMGAEIPPEAEQIGQERAYTSPIWYRPGK